MQKETIEYVEMCLGMEKMAGLYKQVYMSMEYRTGVRVKEYKKLFKGLQFPEIIKRLTARSNNLDFYLKVEDYQFDNSPKKFYSDKRIAVYTALFGNYDTILDPLVQPSNVDYFIFTDIELPKESKWKQLSINSLFNDFQLSNTEKNRFLKMLPHRIFQNYDYSIYVDANVLIVSDLTPMVNAMQDVPIAMFKHKNRDCVYEEAKACIAKNKDKRDRIEDHINLLKTHDIPEHSGLLEATVIVRRHNEAECKELMEKWWDEFLHYSKRDQLSLVDCILTSGLDINSIGILGNNLFKCNKFIILRHN